MPPGSADQMYPPGAAISGLRVRLGATPQEEKLDAL